MFCLSTKDQEWLIEDGDYASVKPAQIGMTKVGGQERKLLLRRRTVTERLRDSEAMARPIRSVKLTRDELSCHVACMCCMSGPV